MIELAAALGPHLASIGASVAASGIYDAIKTYLQSTPNPTQVGLEAAVNNALIVHGQTISAASIVEFMATNGMISITDSDVSAPDGITFGSQGSGSAWFGGNGTMMSGGTGIISRGAGTGIQTIGNAGIVIGKDGSIKGKA